MWAILGLEEAKIRHQIQSQTSLVFDPVVGHGEYYDSFPLPWIGEKRASTKHPGVDYRVVVSLLLATAATLPPLRPNKSTGGHLAAD
jgi:hypothetical protein